MPKKKQSTSLVDDILATRKRAGKATNEEVKSDEVSEDKDKKLPVGEEKLSDQLLKDEEEVEEEEVKETAEEEEDETDAAEFVQAQISNFAANSLNKTFQPTEPKKDKEEPKAEVQEEEKKKEPAITTLNIINAEEVNAALEDSETAGAKLALLINNALTKVNTNAQTEAVKRFTPGMQEYVRRTVEVNQAIDVFWRANEDLRAYEPMIAQSAQDYANAKPGTPLSKILSDTGKEIRKTFKLKEPAKKGAARKPTFPGTSHVRGSSYDVDAATELTTRQKDIQAVRQNRLGRRQNG